MVSRKLIDILLKNKGFIVSTVENGNEAIALYERDVFDLIIMDINMPYLDGYSTTRLIREREEQINRHTPIIALTAYALVGDREKYRDGDG